MSQPLKLLPPVWKSDAGRARPNNEDWAEYETPRDPDLLAQKGILLVVADGAGGHERGQEASRTAVKTVISTYYGDASPDVAASLVNAFKVANAEVFQLSARSSGDKNAMTTLVAAVIRGNELYVAHVGDSRAYLVRGDAIQQLTEDHSWVEEQKRAGVLTEEQARRHPQRSLITRAIGADRDVQVDTNRFTLQPGDAVVLCTDGLTGQMSDEEIKNYVTTQPPREAAQRMIDEVNRRGGFDNITVLIAKTQQTQAMPARSGPPVVRLVGALAVLLAVGLLAVGAWNFAGRFLGDSSTQVAQALATVTPFEVVVTPESTQPGHPAASATPQSQVAGPEPAREPTATLRATSAPQPATLTVAASSTPRTPAVSATPSGTPGNLYPAPELISPKAGDSIIGPATFEWEWTGKPKPNESFDLHVWRLDKPEVSVGQIRETTHRVPAPPDGAGKYQWRVVVIQKRLTDDQIIVVSKMPAPIVLDFWRGWDQVASTPTPSLVPPTNTPTPEPTTATPAPETITPAPPVQGTPSPTSQPMSSQEGSKHATIFSHSTGTHSSGRPQLS